jgi:rhamnose transport system ATP-binding protein
VIGRLGRFGFLNRAGARKLAENAVDAYQIKTSGVDQIVSALSGGNRQKVALAKWLAATPSVLILDEPTHGVDVGAKAQIHEIVAELAARGLAVLAISSDLPEVLAISHRILVVAEGRLVAEFPRELATQEAIMTAATGAREAAHVEA